MTADFFSPGTQDPEDPKPVRAIAVTVFLMLVTAFLYQSMDGVQRADELAERREHLARAACRESAFEDPADGADDVVIPTTPATSQTVTDPTPPADPAVP